MKDKKRKDKVFFSIDPELNKRLENYVNSHAYSKSKLIELLVQKFLDENGL